jgi:hypothetical protein
MRSPERSPASAMQAAAGGCSRRPARRTWPCHWHEA